MEKKNEMNRICKEYATELEDIMSGNLRINNDGQSGIIQYDDNDNEFVIIDRVLYCEDGEATNCNCIGKEDFDAMYDTIDDINELSVMAIADYFIFNDVYNIEWTLYQDLSYKGVSVMVAWGGPNIWIDTMKSAVCIYWGFEEEKYPLESGVVDEIDAYFEELYNSGCRNYAG